MKIFLIILLSLLISILLILANHLCLNSIIFYNFFSKRGRFKKSVDKYNQTHRNYEEGNLYFSQFNDVSVESEDKFVLKGYYKNNESNKTVILVHGFWGSHLDMLDLAKLFDKRGYNILAINQRANGISGGEYSTLGYYEKNDLKVWIDFVVSLNPNIKILLYGISMGGTVVCLNVSENCLPNVSLAISDCAFDNAYKTMAYSLRKRRILFKLHLKNFLRYSKITKGVDFKKVDLSGKLKNAKVPILFVHGDQDDVVPLEMVYSLSNQVPEYRRELFISSGARHIESYKKNPEAFEKCVDKFLSKYSM